MSDSPTSIKLLEIMNDKESKNESVKEILNDSDFRFILYFYLFWLTVLIVFLFLNPWVSLSIGLVLVSILKVTSSIIHNKLSKVLIILKKIQKESEVISYNKSLTDAINLLFHNDREMREQAKEIIYKEYPQHSDVIYSSERIFQDDSESEDDSIPYVRNVSSIH